MAKRKTQKVDCVKNPTHPMCKFVATVKHNVSGGNPVGDELLELLEQFEAALNSEAGPGGDLVLTMADLLRQAGQLDQALWLVDALPSLVPSLTTPEYTLLLSEGMLLRARILDRMPERAFEAENAFALANHFAIMTGRLGRG